MPGRIDAIHRRLLDDNVPSVLDYRPRLGTVVLAGLDRSHPSARSAVLLHEAGGRYWIRQGGETFRIPANADDEVVVNSVKLRVVHAWAEQGDREAAAVLARVHEMVRPQARPRPQPALFPDPFALAFQMFDSALRLGWTLTVPSPWGTVRASFTVR